MADGPYLNRAELARRYGCARSAIGSFLRAAAAGHAADPAAVPPPPRPINPGSRVEVFDAAAFDLAWEARTRRGRPPKAAKPAPPQPLAPMTRPQLAARYGVTAKGLTYALDQAAHEHAAAPEAVEAPPQPVNPGERVLRYRVAEVDRFWWQVWRPRHRPR